MLFQPRRILVVCGLLAGFSAAGCEGGRPTAQVSGVVTFQGQPVEQGLVTFFEPGTGAGGATELQPGGKFAFDHPIPVGSYRVLVSPPPITEAPHDLNVAEVKADNIPEIYQMEDTTTLQAEVKEGENTFEFDMQPGAPSRPTQMAP